MHITAVLALIRGDGPESTCLAVQSQAPRASASTEQTAKLRQDLLKALEDGKQTVRCTALEGPTKFQPCTESQTCTYSNTTKLQHNILKGRLRLQVCLKACNTLPEESRLRY